MSTNGQNAGTTVIKKGNVQDTEKTIISEMIHTISHKYMTNGWMQAIDNNRREKN